MNTQISITWWMDKQKVLHTYNKILFRLKKEWNSDVCCDTEEPGKRHTKEMESGTKGRVRYVSTYSDMSRRRKPRERASTAVVGRVWGAGGVGRHG